jgi:16S rRNA (guanine966-N2)-methyltransferase
VKIHSGQWRGRIIAQPKTRTVRPLSEKARAAIFDVIGPVSGLAVLDAYAGSGAAGLEALSRGALLAEAIEANRTVARTIQANVETLGAEWGYLLHMMTVETWLASPRQQLVNGRYDAIIADPPYHQLDADVLGRLMLFLLPEGRLVVSHSSKRHAPMIESGELIQTKRYGDSSLSFYKKI